MKTRPAKEQTTMTTTLTEPKTIKSVRVYGSNDADHCVLCGSEKPDALASGWVGESQLYFNVHCGCFEAADET